ncbi:DELLA protein GAI [Platanthera guangdongensis]|uniref:DELLA protein n=1 Tax=Platanthera guangdongensis TaxID=2320717 RepID=A0ABR2MIV4_9ASPA
MGESSYGHGSDDAKSEIDSLLAGVGYSIRPSDLRQVAERLEKLDSAMIAAAAAGLPPEFLCSDAVHYNPSDLAAWIESMAMLTDFSPDHFRPTNPAPASWTGDICPPAPGPPHPVANPKPPEDAGISLVHLLMSCADSIHRGDRPSASTLIHEMQLLLPRVGTAFGIGKVAGYFIDALDRRLRSRPLPQEDDILYHYYYESSPYLKFAHFTANQAILEAFNGCDRVHVIDLSLMHGLQWPALIQALALRPGGPPLFRLTGIGPPEGREALCEVGRRLSELARSVGVPFTFRGVVAAHLDEVRLSLLRVESCETLAVNSVLQFHRLLADPGSPGPINSLLSWLRRLRPRIVTVVEQEADHNRPVFLDRFTEALFYYSTVFDSLETAGGGRPAEVYLHREICNIVCCEGEERLERHEPLASWRTRFSQAGLWPVHLGSDAFRQASMLLTLFSGEGYGVEEVDGCLALGWHGRAIISASAWHAGDDMDAPPSTGSILFNGFRESVAGESSGSNREIELGSQTEHSL